MAEVFYLPKMGQTMTEATILRWLRQEGDHVEGWEGIVEMMTDKINMEVEPQITGTIRKILAPEGAVVPIGDPIAIIGSPNEDIASLLANPGRAGISSDDESGPTPQAVISSASTVLEPAAAPPPADKEFPSVSPRAREAAAAAGLNWKELTFPGSGDGGMVVERDIAAYLASQETARQIGISPLARKMADELGVPTADLSGTGPGGKIRSDDVRRAAGRKRSVSLEPRTIPLQGIRKVIATRLSASYQQAVHVPLRVEIDMSAAAELRRQLKPMLETAGLRLSFTDLIAAAAVQALVQFPILNATLENDVIQIHDGVHLGMAVALDDGLVVPVIRQAQNKSLFELGEAVVDVARRARAGKLGSDEYSGGSFTLSNLGQFGIDSFDPIINPPQVAILGTGRIADRVVAVGGSPQVRPMLAATLVFDHRVTDGAPAAGCLALIKELLENPARLLL